MVRKALQAFIEADADLAKSVLLLDDQVDEMNEDAFYAFVDPDQGEARAYSTVSQRADHRAPLSAWRPRYEHR